MAAVATAPMALRETAEEAGVAPSAQLYKTSGIIEKETRC
jgi:hypothetical protein